ncbi:hypothetical protein ASD05_14410 [Variovorax sp. Root434]|nr:hypothetical protein ASD05_14410 [Variovorax sp. Root434]
MPEQFTRNNHYVPQWYQRGFLAKGSHKLHVLNVTPMTRPVGDDRTVIEPELESNSPKLLFKEVDLYTTRFGEDLNDDIERLLFGKIDFDGAPAVRAWIANDVVEIHKRFHDFFRYIDAQKLRTPKGLDWILKRYGALSQTKLMEEMQRLGEMHIAMWTEAVREIVSARLSGVKFVVSDHPVTMYHQLVPPGTSGYEYPNDPGIDLVGSQTIFALDANHCLILTNLEYVDSRGERLLSRRTNARFRSGSLARTDACIRGRDLNDAEVRAINFAIKSRARKYVAASDPEFLYPEREHLSGWEGVAPVLMPKSQTWLFGGETFIGYKDGRTDYRDPFGRTSSAHKYLAKESPKEISSDLPCGCGSGFAFSACCDGRAVHERPSWTTLSIRERNLALCRAVRGILEVDKSTGWLEIRERLNNDHVRRINEAFAALWPLDTSLAELLPWPQLRRSRALLLGMVDPRTVQRTLTGILPYFDEVIAVHPFINPNGVRPEYSPITSPGKFKEQTLRNCITLLVLEPDIWAGKVHLVPDPLDFDPGFRNEIMQIMESRCGDMELGPLDSQLSKALSRDEMLRAIRRLPPKELKEYMRRRSEEAGDLLSDTQLDQVVVTMKRDLENDDLATLDPLSGSKEGEFKTLKGLSRETGLYMAAMTGSIVYTDSDTQWRLLHETDGLHEYQPLPEFTGIAKELSQCEFWVPGESIAHDTDPPGAMKVREAIRQAFVGTRSNGTVELQTSDQDSEASSPADGHEATLLPLRVDVSIPQGGFQRTDVTRLLLQFGRQTDVAAAPMGLFLTARLER